METHLGYQHRPKLMPPFKGSQMNGPPMLKGPPTAAVRAGPWSHPKGPPSSSFNPYTMRLFGAPRSPHYPDSSFEPYLSEPEPLPEPMPELQEPEHPEQDHQHRQHGPAEASPEEHPPPPPGAGLPEGEMTGGGRVQITYTMFTLLSL